MNELRPLLPIVAGILGTAVMSTLTWLCFKICKRPYYVVRSLALVLNLGKQATLTGKVGAMHYALAVFLHYGIGILFAFAYTLAFSNNFSFGSTLIFGMLIGIIGIVGWKIFLTFNKHPLNLQLRIYFTVLWLGQVFLAITMFYYYKTIEMAKPIAQDIPMC